MKKQAQFLLLFLVICAAIVLCIYFIIGFIDSNQQVLWKYQCIDTMKVSRDSARDLGKNPNASVIINGQIKKIKDLGANCVAIDTPYDDEFIPYLEKWVYAARAQGLTIWFRGNWSSWEGWFGYPKNMTPQNHIAKTREFIKTHVYLFKDGDIFTPIPEPENGWSNGYMENYPAFRAFLIQEYQETQTTFQNLGKHIITNWISMSGGVATSILDQSTITALGNVVTIDHYVQNPDDMGKYIEYFNKKFHARVVIGEFGAPIADITGDMTDHEQAVFIESLLHQLYIHRDSVLAINYWVLSGGSTALIDENGKEKEATKTIKDYYSPGIITGRVVNTIGFPLSHITVETYDGMSNTTTSITGEFHIVVPAKDTEIIIKGKGFKTKKQKILVSQKEKMNQLITLEPSRPGYFYTIVKKIKSILDASSLH